MSETVTIHRDDLRLLMQHAAAAPQTPDSGLWLNDALARCGDALDTPAEPPLPGGQWLEIAFMGHIEYRGAYVREVTRNGQPAYRVELPPYVFGGDPSAVRHHAASSWFGDRPVSEASVRKVWEAQQEAEKRRAEREAEWQRQQAERTLPAGAEDEAESDDCTSRGDGENLDCPQHGSPF